MALGNNTIRGHGQCATVNPAAAAQADRRVSVAGADAFLLGYADVGTTTVLAYLLTDDADADMAALTDASGWLLPGVQLELDVRDVDYLVVKEFAITTGYAVVGQIS